VLRERNRADRRCCCPIGAAARRDRQDRQGRQRDKLSAVHRRKFIPPASECANLNRFGISITRQRSAVDQDNALSVDSCVQGGFERDALVIAFRRAHEFFHVRRADNFARAHFRTARAAPALSGRTGLRAIHSKILRFRIARPHNRLVESCSHRRQQLVRHFHRRVSPRAEAEYDAQRPIKIAIVQTQARIPSRMSRFHKKRWRTQHRGSSHGAIRFS